jgi:hypothetical protein
MESNKAQAGLERAIASLARDLPGLPTGEACARIAQLKRAAVLEGFLPTAELADGLARALRRQGRRAPIASWLDALAAAAGCGTADAGVSTLLMATVGVRFAL